MVRTIWCFDGMFQNAPRDKITNLENTPPRQNEGRLNCGHGNYRPRASNNVSAASKVAVSGIARPITTVCFSYRTVTSPFLPFGVRFFHIAMLQPMLCTTNLGTFFIDIVFLLLCAYGIANMGLPSCSRTI